MESISIELKLNRMFLLIIIAGFLFSINKYYANASEGFIRRICLAQFASEMDLAKQIPPEGMDKYTCDCFMSEIVKGNTITLAQLECKEKASVKFNLLKSN